MAITLVKYDCFNVSFYIVFRIIVLYNKIYLDTSYKSTNFSNPNINELYFLIFMITKISLS